MYVIHPFKEYSSVVFSMSTELYNHHRNLLLEDSIIPKRNPITPFFCKDSKEGVFMKSFNFITNYCVFTEVPILKNEHCLSSWQHDLGERYN